MSRAIVTQQEMQANIAHCDIVKHVSRGGHILRWAVLTTQNGSAVVGRPSVTVSPNKDNAAIGAVIAISNAEQELWPLMHYACKQ